MIRCKLLVPILVTSIIQTTSGQNESQLKILDNFWSFAVIGGVVGIVLLLLLLSCVIGKYRKARLQIIYDGCGPSDYRVKYQVRVKTGSSLEVSSANNPKQFGSLTMDLCKPNGAFIARIRVPEATVRRKNNNDSNKKASKNSNSTKIYQFCFASIKSEKDLDIGSIRLDYSKFGERVFVHYIQIKGLEGTSSIYRCFVNSKIGLVKPVCEELIPSTQTFPCRKNGVTDQSDPYESDLSPGEYVLFFMVPSSIHCVCCRYFLYDIAEPGIDYSSIATSGTATGFLSLFITFLAIVVYRIGIKKNLGPKIINAIRITILIILVTLSFAFYVSAAILGSDLTDEQLMLWAVAIAVGIAVIILVGLPLVIAFQYCCRCVSPEGDLEENETITQTLKSALGDQGTDSGLQPTSMAQSPKPGAKTPNPVPKKLVGMKGKSPNKVPTKRTRINTG